jgi:hypothetical protein
MEVPYGLEDSSSMGKVCKLKKTLYGRNQSPIAWFEQFSWATQRFDYKQSQVDHTLVIKHFSQVITALIVYIDDIVIIGNDDEELQNLK